MSAVTYSLSCSFGSTSSSRIIVSPARSFSHLDVDAEHLDRLKWVLPEKWYALTKHSAQSHSPIRQHRDQTDAPLQATKPTENPYSLTPAFLNRFSDISPNPKLNDNSPKVRHKPTASASTIPPFKGPSCVVNSFGLMRKCHNPFNEGWKLKTFKPAREKLVPYEAKVSKVYNDRGFGYLEYQRQVRDPRW
jgi:hypothetical protein